MDTHVRPSIIIAHVAPVCPRVVKYQPEFIPSSTGAPQSSTVRYHIVDRVFDFYVAPRSEQPECQVGTLVTVLNPHANTSITLRIQYSEAQKALVICAWR